MNVTVTWHGHANFQLAGGGLNILVDPFFTGNSKVDCGWNDIPAVDLILITHMHGDHIGDTAALAKKHNCAIAAIVGSSGHLAGLGTPEGMILGGGFNIGGTIAFKGAEITMTEAFHTADAAFPAGFIIKMPGGFTVYHSGDTGIFRNMKTWGELYNIDLALLPVGGYYTMDQRQAALAASYLRAKAMVPMHWGTFPALVQNPDSIAGYLHSYAPTCKLYMMQPGQSLTF